VVLLAAHPKLELRTAGEGTMHHVVHVAKENEDRRGLYTCARVLGSASEHVEFGP